MTTCDARKLKKIQECVHQVETRQGPTLKSNQCHKLINCIVFLWNLRCARAVMEDTKLKRILANDIRSF